MEETDDSLSHCSENDEEHQKFLREMREERERYAEAVVDEAYDEDESDGVPITVSNTFPT